VEFDTGSFDDYCVYLTRPGQPKYAPSDLEYFSRLKLISNNQGAARIYNDYLLFYEGTGKDINQDILNQITVISHEYENDAEEMDTWFTVIYAGMIAEENKANAILKKRIKRLGMHQLLLEDFSPEEAANFSRNKKWQELDAVMKQKGF
jgi:hypothetical protein